MLLNMLRHECRWRGGLRVVGVHATLRIPTITANCCGPVRTRATYYQPSRSWVPRFIRRFFLRHPKARVMVPLVIMASFAFSPCLYWVYPWLTMSSAEYEAYATQHNSAVQQRLVFGSDLMIPMSDRTTTLSSLEPEKQHAMMEHRQQSWKTFNQRISDWRRPLSQADNNGAIPPKN